MVEPSLSSVAQPGFRMGMTATQLLLDLIEKKKSVEEYQEPVVLSTELLIRKSSVRVHPN